MCEVLWLRCFVSRPALRHALYKYHQTRFLPKLLMTTISCETLLDSCLLMRAFWLTLTAWLAKSGLNFMELYQNDDKNDEIFSSGQNFLGQERRLWSQLCQSSMERNNLQEKVAYPVWQYFWFGLIARFPENIWLVTRWLTNENIINRFCSKLMSKKLSIIWN